MLILVLLLQWKELLSTKMGPTLDFAKLCSVLPAIWLQKFILINHTKVLKLTYSLLLSFYSSWSLDIHLSQRLLQRTSTTKQSPWVNQISSGKLTPKVKTRISSLKNSKLLSCKCLLLIQIKDQVCRNWQAIHGCKDQLQALDKFKLNLLKEID